MSIKFGTWGWSCAEWEPGCMRRLPDNLFVAVVLVHRPGEGYFIREAFADASKPMPYLAGPFETEEAAIAAVQLMTS